MTKLCFIYRKAVPEFFSIEKVFARVIGELKNLFDIREFKVPYTRLTPANLLRNIIAASGQKADIYHVTGDIHYAVLGFPSEKTVLTIHDCVFLHHENKLKRAALKFLFLTLPVRHCSVITTISEATKSDIIRNTGCLSSKVVVIPNPLSNTLKFTNFEFNASCPRILFIGTTPNKNLQRAIDAVTGVNCILEVIGKIPDGIMISADSQLRIENSYFLTEDELALKYTNADIVLFPSLFEGFGLPVLEAQQVGRPIVTSNIEPLVGVAGKGACFVDPMSVDSIRDGLLRVINEKEFRDKIIAEGKKNAEGYSSQLIAGMYQEVYNSVLSRKNN